MVSDRDIGEKKMFWDKVPPGEIRPASIRRVRYGKIGAFHYGKVAFSRPKRKQEEKKKIKRYRIFNIGRNVQFYNVL